MVSLGFPAGTHAVESHNDTDSPALNREKKPTKLLRMLTTLSCWLVQNIPSRPFLEIEKYLDELLSRANSLSSFGRGSSEEKNVI